MNYSLILKGLIFAVSVFIILFVTVLGTVELTRNVFPLWEDKEVVCFSLTVGISIGFGMLIFSMFALEDKGYF